MTTTPHPLFPWPGHPTPARPGNTLLPCSALALALLLTPCHAQQPPPATETPAPATETPAPAAETPAPAAETPAPAIETPAPAEPTAPAAEPPAPQDPLAKHRDGSTRLAGEQDELAADVQQLVLEQTVDKVIKLLEEVGDAMDDATDRLEQQDTGGETIAAQTDVIEKIYEAARERQKQGSGDAPNGAMMDMLERMMGRTPDVDRQAGNNQPADQGGEGLTGDSDTANQQTGGKTTGKAGERRVPKASGTAGRAVPAEFRDALDAYNRGSEELAK